MQCVSMRQCFLVSSQNVMVSTLVACGYLGSSQVLHGLLLHEVTIALLHPLFLAISGAFISVTLKQFWCREWKNIWISSVNPNSTKGESHIHIQRTVKWCFVRAIFS